MSGQASLVALSISCYIHIHTCVAGHTGVQLSSCGRFAMNGCCRHCLAVHRFLGSICSIPVTATCGEHVTIILFAHLQHAADNDHTQKTCMHACMLHKKRTHSQFAGLSHFMQTQSTNARTHTHARTHARTHTHTKLLLSQAKMR